MAFLMSTESRTSLLIISGSWGIINVTCFLLPAVSSLFILGPFEANTIAWWAQKGPDNTRQLAELVHIEDDMYGKNSGPGTIFLNCQTIRISSVSISILNKFYCISFILCIWGRMFITWEMCTKKKNPFCYFLSYTLYQNVGVWFSPSIQTGPWTHLDSCTMGTASLSWGVVWPGQGIDQTLPSSTKVKDRVSSLWAFMAYFKVNFTFLPFYILTNLQHS